MSKSGTREASRLVRSAQSPAGCQDRHVALEIGHHGEAVRIAHQDLQDRDLEIRPSCALS